MGAELSPATSGEAKMTESKNRRADKDTSVRKSIEEERARDKSREDEVANSSDDSFPASDPPSFTGVPTAAELSFIGRCESEFLDRIYSRCDRTQRRVGRENHLIGAKEFQPTARCCNAAAEHRRIGKKIVQIVHVLSFQGRENF